MFQEKSRVNFLKKNTKEKLKQIYQDKIIHEIVKPFANMGVSYTVEVCKYDVAYSPDTAYSRVRLICYFRNKFFLTLGIETSPQYQNIYYIENEQKWILSVLKHTFKEFNMCCKLRKNNKLSIDK